MKKTILLGTVFAGVMLLCSGCGVAYVGNSGFAAAYPSLIYTNETHASYIAPKVENFDNMEVLGHVTGTATAVNTLFIVTAGDTGIAKAKANALKHHPGAEDIVNLEVDTDVHSILGLFTSVTTTISGKAIKYKKNKNK